RRDPARRGLRRRAAARTAIGQGDHATWRRDRRRDPAYAHAEWLTPGVSREEWRPAVHLDSLRPRSDRRVLGYPGDPGVARSAGRFVTKRRAEPLTPAGQMVPRDPALRGARPAGRQGMCVRYHRLARDPVHWPLPAA